MRTLGTYKTSTTSSVKKVSKTMTSLRNLKRSSCLSIYANGITGYGNGGDGSAFLIKA